MNTIDNIMKLVHDMASDREIRTAIEQAIKDEREKSAHAAGEYARKWWSRHSATNKHMTTTLEAHNDFCALQVAILQRSET